MHEFTERNHDDREKKKNVAKSSERANERDRRIVEKTDSQSAKHYKKNPPRKEFSKKQQCNDIPWRLQTDFHTPYFRA